MADKRNPDYSESAINLCNPVQVAGLLHSRKAKLDEMEHLQAVLVAYPEYEQLQERGKEITDIDSQIRIAINDYGSYQDVITGMYGVKQLRRTITFAAEKVREVIPQYAEAVIDGVNKTKINGLIKGGLITQEQANQCSETKEDCAYIIK